MSDNLDAQPGGRLLKLPSEIRLLIYEHLFPPRKVDIHAPRADQWADNNDRHARSADIAILTTCRTIHAEAAPVLYENTEFYISFACSGRDLISMKLGKHRIYARLLQDLQGRVRSLFSMARKISLSIVFTDSNAWEEAERTWFQQLTSELARLGDAPKLKQLHVTFEADENSDPMLYVFPSVNKDFERVLAVLSKVECRATVTAAIHPALGTANPNLSTYFDTLAKLRWTDTTHEVYSKWLARLSKRRSLVEQEIRTKRERLASQDPQCLDEYYNNRRRSSYFDMEDLLQMAQSTDWSVDIALHQMRGREWEHECLYQEITSVEGHLRWFASACSRYRRDTSSCPV